MGSGRKPSNTFFEIVGTTSDSNSKKKRKGEAVDCVSVFTGRGLGCIARVPSIVLRSFLVLVLTLVIGIASAETIIGEFSGDATHDFAVGSPLEERISATGFVSGERISGSFAYQSDAPVMQDEFPAVFLYEADYIRVQIGEVLLEETEDIVVVVSDSGAFGGFSVGPSDNLFDPLSFSVLGTADRSPISSIELPLTTSDVDIDFETQITALGGNFPTTNVAFSLGPSCDANNNGDIDGDGEVAFSDFLILSNNFGNDGRSHELGDIDCSGAVDFADFLVLADNFGEEIATAQSVPEPTCRLPSLLLFFCICRGRAIDDSA